MKLSIGFSPCPNDCFIFDALIHQKIDNEGLEFDVIMTDVEDLNKKAFANELDITKLSYHAFFYLTQYYTLLNSGSALGFGCGPILVCKNDRELESIPSKDWKVAIPGKYTTANFLFSLVYPDIENKDEIVFSEIEDSVLEGRVDAGLLIHENRFTFEKRGLKKIVDLGEFWEEMISAPIPLGGIVIKKKYDEEIINKVEKLIRKSVEYAFANPNSSLGFVKENAKEMDEEVMKQHINLYVNEFSLDLGDLGKSAVELMYKEALEKNILSGISSSVNSLFLR